jgi:cell division protein FtsW
MQHVRNDWVLFWTTVGLTCLGLVMVYSASGYAGQRQYGFAGYFILRQFLWALAAFLLMMLIKRIDYRKLNTAAWAFGSIGVVVVLLLAVFVLGGRAQRFLRWGLVGMQPSELAKPALILFLAFFVSRRAKAINDRHTLLPASLTVGLLAIAVVIADLGTAVVLVATAAVVFFLAGLRWRYVSMVLVVGLVAGGVAIAVKPYRLGRILPYLGLTPEKLEQSELGRKVKAYVGRSVHTRDPDYHVRQSKLAVASGGLVGQGLTDSKQKLGYLPEAHTDFIYAVVGEELGLAGCVVLLLAFVLILWRGLRLARIQDEFGRYVAIGVTCVIVLQALINMSVVLGLAPTKGIPLPMISYGGSSLLSTLVSLGLMMSVSEQAG